eukprot:651483-Pelagomonas_calceolata.AAC.7
MATFAPEIICCTAFFWMGEGSMMPILTSPGCKACTWTDGRQGGAVKACFDPSPHVLCAGLPHTVVPLFTKEAADLPGMLGPHLGRGKRAPGLLTGAGCAALLAALFWPPHLAWQRAPHQAHFWGIVGSSLLEQGVLYLSSTPMANTSCQLACSYEARRECSLPKKVAAASFN